jgi:hypothetical protein
MPSAFSVANSPLTANGTIAVTGAGVASQYIRGDGTLATLPTGGGGGSSVAYYLNGSVNQGTFGGNTYYEMSKVPIIGTGTDFTISSNGYISQFITDAGDPSLLNIPAGNWNFEMYFSASSGGGAPSFYVELYKYDGVVFTLIASSSAIPEGITNGTAIDLYLTALAVPSTALTITDRLAIRVYVNNSGRTITLHTENSHLCQVITTFSTGLTALNGLTAQVQNLTTGTSGTDFNINSLVDTHTFNIPDASATARGLITTGTQTIAGTKTFNDATKNNGGILLQNASSNSLAGYMNLGGLTNGVKFTSGGGISNTFTLPSATGYTFTFPNATGTLALTSDISYPVTSVFGRTGAVVATSGDYTTDQVTEGTTNLYFTTLRARGAISATTPLVYSSVAGTMSIDKADTSLSGYLSATDWTTFNNKQAALSGTGFIKISGTTISYDNSTYYLASNPSLFIALTALSAGVGISYNNTTGVITNSLPDQTVALTASTGISVTGTYPNFTITNTSPSSGGTVTSVAALTIGTSGTDVSSTVANSTTTPVITLNIPSASATNRGLVTTGTQTFAGVKIFNDNIGIGVTPNSGWNSAFKTIQLSRTGNLTGFETRVYLSTNFYINSSAGYKYIESGYATMYEQSAGEHTWYTAPLFSGGTGDLTFTNVMKIGNTGIVTLYNLAGTGSRMVVADSTGVLSTQAIPTGTVTTSGSPTTNYLPKFTGASTIGDSIVSDNGSRILINTGTTNQNTTINASKIAMSRTSDGAEVVYFSKNTDLGSEGTANINGYDGIQFRTQGAESVKATLNASGNLGLGVTPSAWRNGWKTLQVANTSISSDSAQTFFAYNAYLASDDFRYINSDNSTIYRQVSGQHIWATAPSGTAGNAITFTQAMTLTAAGRLLLGTTTESTYLLDVNGTGRFVGNLTVAKSDASNDILLKVQQLSNTAAAGIGLVSNVDGLASYNFIYSATNAGSEHWKIFGDGTANTLAIQTGGTTRLTIASGGGATFTGSVTATSFFESSSIKGKDIIATNPLLALDIDVIKYTRKSDKSKDIRYGYSAEQIHSLMPELTDKDVTAVKYLDVHTILISQLQKEIKELKAKIN